MLRDRIRIGTRGSRLALAQAQAVSEMLMKHNPGVVVELVPLKTLGDIAPPSRQRGSDGKTAFTGEIEKALMEGRVDAAVHSLKDLPGELGEGMEIAAIPPRADPRDVFVSASGVRLEQTPAGAKVGTSSVRRRAQLLGMRKDLVVQEIHGNVETRLKKLSAEGLDGIVVAAAGLKRLGMEDAATQHFDPATMTPAVGQGCLAVEARAEDEYVTPLLKRLEDATSRAEAECERAFARVVGGDCFVPVAANAKASAGNLRLIGMIASPDGTQTLKEWSEGKAADAAIIGAGLAKRLLDEGGSEVLEGTRA